MSSLDEPKPAQRNKEGSMNMAPPLNSVVRLNRRAMLALGAASLGVSSAVAAELSPGVASPKVVVIATFKEIGAHAVPAGVDMIVTLGHSVIGRGGAQYLRRDKVLPSAYCAISKDGGCFELAESTPDVTMFGAIGDGAADDSDAFEAGIDYVRAHAAYPRRAAGLAAGALHIPPGTFKLTRSMNLTGDKGVQGLGLKGAGQFSSVLIGELREAYPVLDISGMSGAEIADLQIRCSTESLASCCILAAQGTVANFHNRYPQFRNLLLQMSAGADIAISPLVIQNADLASLDNVICDGGAIGLSIGWRLPPKQRLRVQSVVERSIRLNTRVAADVVGYPVRIGSQHRSQLLGRVTSASGDTLKIEAEGAWHASPKIGDPVEISAIRSKFLSVSSGIDSTNYRIRNCQFTGETGLMFTGGASLSLADTYVAAYRKLGPLRSVIVVSDPYQVAPSSLRGYNLRTENQTDGIACNAIMLDGGELSVDIRGELDIINRSWQPPQGAILASQNGGEFIDVELCGSSSGAPMLLDTPTRIRSLRGSFRADGGPGRYGPIDALRFDWRNGSKDKLWAALNQSRHNAA